MNSNTILNVTVDQADPTSVASVGYVDTVLGAVDADSILAMQGDITTLQTDVGTLQTDLNTLEANFEKLVDNVRDVVIVDITSGNVTLSATQSRASAFVVANTGANGRELVVTESVDNPAVFFVRVAGTYTSTLKFSSLVTTHTLQPGRVYAFAYSFGVGCVNLMEGFYQEFDALDFTESIVVAASDEAQAISTTGVKTTFRMPYGFTLTDIKASLTTATSGTFTVDVLLSGSSILSTPLTFDATEKTTNTAATQPVISTSALTDDGEVTIDVTNVGGGTATGLKVTFIGTKS
jgi:hypothetical protein